MSETTQRPFQYMIDLGVPKEDVSWLKLVASTPAGQIGPEVRARMKRIQDQAYRNLVEAAALPDYAVLQ